MDTHDPAASAVNAAMLSLDDIDAVQLGETPYEFEYILDDGRHTGVFLSVYGSQTNRVQSAINALNNERRKQQAVADAAAAASGGEVTVRPVEEDQEHGKRLAAVRLAGWRGLKDKFTEANALRLCKVNADIAAVVVQKANNIGNFMKVSLPKP